MHFEKFPKIPSIARAIKEWAMIYGPYLVSEKMDGANSGILRTHNGLVLHSRNQFLAFLGEDPTEDRVSNELQGFVHTVTGYRSELLDILNVSQHVYGEWLVPHTVSYPAEMYRKWYPFPLQLDIVQESELAQLPLYGAIPTFGTVDYSINTELSLDPEALLAKAADALEGRVFEGIVLQHVEESYVRAKIVQDKFKEDIAKKWSTKQAKNSSGPEAALATLYRAPSYLKVRQRAEDLRGPLDKTHTPMVMGLAWHDFVEEHLARGLKSLGYPVIDTRLLKREVDTRVRAMFHSELDVGSLPQWAHHGQDNATTPDRDDPAGPVGQERAHADAGEMATA